MSNFKEPLLHTDGLGIDFGGLRALDSLDLSVYEGEIVGLIGPNGAGKTTVFNIITSVYKPTRGTIRVCGKRTDNKSTFQVNQMGVSRTFQNIKLFDSMTVIDNIKTAFHNKASYSISAALFRSKKFWEVENLIEEEAKELLEFFNMSEFKDNLASDLPYGAQRKLEIARAMACNPKVILLDEPAAGMNDTETKELTQTVEKIRDQFKLSILLIEHDMNLIMDICDRIVVLDYGKMLSSGIPEEVRNDPKVIEAYLGKD